MKPSKGENSYEKQKEKLARPVIGITCAWSVETWGHERGRGGYLYVGKHYIDCILDAGGLPFIIPLVTEDVFRDFNVDEITDFIDGLILSGGGDSLAKKEKKIGTLEEQQPCRYKFERELFLKSYSKGIPVLGICRGLQMIVEALGGSLHEDTVKGHNQVEEPACPTHMLLTREKTQARKVLGNESIKVNSFHAQTVNNIPNGFMVSGLSEDGVIEFIESTTSSFVWGVQFHPEEMYFSDEKMRKIINAFVEKTKEFKLMC